jgi:ADP-sugar diphosphatase
MTSSWRNATHLFSALRSCLLKHAEQSLVLRSPSRRIMSTFALSSKTPFPGVNVTLPSDLSSEQLLSFRPFNQWLDSLAKSLSLQQQATHPFNDEPYKLRDIEVQSVDFFSESRLGFVKLRATVQNDNGEKLPGSVFMRGGSVAMLILLSAENMPQAQVYALLTIQPRIAAGSMGFVELPAGMIDNSGTFSGAAAKEIKEETGLDIREDELVDMSKLTAQVTMESDLDTTLEAHLQQGVYPSPGGCDEFIPLFVVRKRMAAKEIESLAGRLTGLRDHGEKITLELVKVEDVWKVGARDAKTLAAMALYEGLTREGKL